MTQTIEHIYRVSPVWAQHLAVSVRGIGWRLERLGGRYTEHVAGFVERDKWSPATMNDYVERQLQKVLTRAFEQVPIYRQKWREAGILSSELKCFGLDSLARLPIVRKQDFRDDPTVFVADDVRGRRLRSYKTSGSTGTPITSLYTVDGHRRFTAAREARSFGWAGTSMARPRSMIGGRMVVPGADSGPPFHRYNAAEKQVYFSSYHISPENAIHYVAALNRHQPEVLTGYAYAHYILGRLILEQGLQLNYAPKAAILSSEKLTSEMRDVIALAFRTRPYEEYGAVENCSLATECEHAKLHVSLDFGIVEIVDDDGVPVPAGKEGRLICTGLMNEAQFLVRYEIGDRGVWSSEKCPCGRDHLPVLQEVVGRIEDVVVGANGRRVTILQSLFAGLPRIREAQIVQEETDRFRIRVVAVEGFGRSEEDIIHERLVERLGNVRVQFERVPQIERTKHGKFRAVINNVKGNGCT